MWIGGNSQRTLRRVAERAQGWMPLIGPPEVSSTSRTAHLASLEDVAASMAKIRDMAGTRPIDLSVAYADRSIWAPQADTERHRDALGALETVGATWVIVSGPSGSPEESLAFIQAFPPLFA